MHTPRTLPSLLLIAQLERSRQQQQTHDVKMHERFRRTRKALDSKLESQAKERWVRFQTARRVLEGTYDVPEEFAVARPILTSRTARHASPEPPTVGKFWFWGGH